jgi:hypothetical protein
VQFEAGDLDEARARLISARPAASVYGGIRTVLAPRLVPEVREVLETAGWSYCDLEGHLLVQSRKPLIWVARDDQSLLGRIGSEPARSMSMTGEPLDDIVEYLLGLDGPLPSVRRVANYAGVSVASASRCLRLLRERSMFVPGPNLELHVDRSRLYGHWVSEFGFMKSGAPLRYAAPVGVERVLQRLTAFEVGYVTTGWWGVRAYLGSTTELPTPYLGESLWLYVENIQQVTEIAELVPDALNGQIWLARGGAARKKNPQTIEHRGAVVGPWRLAADLSSGSDRLRIVGEWMARQMLNSPGLPF